MKKQNVNSRVVPARYICQELDCATPRILTKQKSQEQLTTCLELLLTSQKKCHHKWIQTLKQKPNIVTLSWCYTIHNQSLRNHPTHLRRKNWWNSRRHPKSFKPCVRQTSKHPELRLAFSREPLQVSAAFLQGTVRRDTSPSQSQRGQERHTLARPLRVNAAHSATAASPRQSPLPAGSPPHPTAIAHGRG